MNTQPLDPQYRADINALAEELRREHGAQAFEVAVKNAREYIDSSAWKNCALWLQVVNRLGAPQLSRLEPPQSRLYRRTPNKAARISA